MSKINITVKGATNKIDKDTQQSLILYSSYCKQKPKQQETKLQFSLNQNNNPSSKIPLISADHQWLGCILYPPWNRSKCFYLSFHFNGLTSLTQALAKTIKTFNPKRENQLRDEILVAFQLNCQCYKTRENKRLNKMYPTTSTPKKRVHLIFSNQVVRAQCFHFKLYQKAQYTRTRTQDASTNHFCRYTQTVRVTETICNPSCLKPQLELDIQKPEK